MVKDPDTRRKSRQEIDEDDQKANALLKILPDAFLFSGIVRQGGSIRLNFRPNPKYSPSSNEAKVFHQMAGVLVINAKETRLARIAGKLTSDVDFGLGILAKIQKGGTFNIVQSEIAPGDWEITLLDVHISGRALFFHTIAEQQHEVETRFKPVPAGISLQQAASLVQQAASDQRQ